MNLRPLVTYPAILSLLWIISLVHCSEQAPTINPVRSIELKDLEKVITGEDFSGLLVAMASWCPPCREELPILAELYRDYKKEGIDIVAVSVDVDGPSAVQPLIDELKIPFPVYWVGTSAVQYFRLSGIPTLMVYHQGRLLEKIPGSQSRKAMEQKIKSLLQSLRQ